MIKIESSKILKRDLALQLACGALILLAYFISRMLVFVAGIVAMGYLFSGVKWEQKFAMFMFLLSFSPIFKYTGIDTSIFMFLRIAIVVSYVFQNKQKIDSTYILITIMFFAYCIIVSEVSKTDYLISAINLILWITIGYVLVHTISPSNSASVIKCLSNGIIISGIIGLFLENIPQLQEEVTVLMTLTEDGAYVHRFAGFWGDPNFYSVILIASMWFIYHEFNNDKVTIIEFLLRCAIASFLGLMTMSKSCILLMIIFWSYVLFAKNNIKTAPKVVLFFALIIAASIFMWKNPYWLGDILYRFTGNEEEFTTNTLTTGRLEIWRNYIERISTDFSWIFGNGLNKANFENKAMHNTIIQGVYYVGIVGFTLFISLILKVYKSVNVNSSSKPKKTPAKYALASLLVTAMFLDGFLIEQYYYMLTLSFVYILNVGSNEFSDKKTSNTDVINPEFI